MVHDGECQERERRNIAVYGVVDDCSSARAGHISEHGKIRRKEEKREEQPGCVLLPIDEYGKHERKESFQTKPYADGAADGVFRDLHTSRF